MLATQALHLQAVPAHLETGEGSAGYLLGQVSSRETQGRQPEGKTMSTQTITTSYEWEAERIADELRQEDAVIICVDGHTVTVRGISWTLEPGHLRAICSVVHVAHATLDGVEVVWET